MVTHILGLRLHGSRLVFGAPTRRAVLGGLSRVQTASAAVVAAFGVVHLSAPLVGLVAGGDVNDRVDGVSRWMLLGRVAYQGGVGEVVVWGALAVHVVAGLAKRLVTRFTVAGTSRTEEKEQVVPTAKMTWAQRSGWLLTPAVIHHVLVNRVIPASPRPPIASLSPSELDYSFVSHALSHPNLRVRSVMATAYALLIGAFAVHVTYALPALLRSLPRTNSAADSKRTLRSRSKAQVSTSLAVLLSASLVSIIPIRSQLTISATLKDRYDAVLACAWPARLFLTSSS